MDVIRTWTSNIMARYLKMESIGSIGSMILGSLEVLGSLGDQVPKLNYDVSGLLLCGTSSTWFGPSKLTFVCGPFRHVGPQGQDSGPGRSRMFWLKLRERGSQDLATSQPQKYVKQRPKAFKKSLKSQYVTYVRGPGSENTSQIFPNSCQLSMPVAIGSLS